MYYLVRVSHDISLDNITVPSSEHIEITDVHINPVRVHVTTERKRHKGKR